MKNLCISNNHFFCRVIFQSTKYIPKLRLFTYKYLQAKAVNVAVMPATTTNYTLLESLNTVNRGMSHI